MKQLKQSVLYVGILFFLILTPCIFLACGNRQKKADPIYKRASNMAVLYEDVVFYFDYNSFEPRYQKLDAITEEGLPLYSDILAEGDENPFYKISTAPYILVDEAATKENDNHPVLLMSYTKSEVLGRDKFRTVDRIVSYETNTQKVTVLLEIEESIQSLELYGDYIYFTTNEGDQGWNVHRMDKNGKNHMKMDNPDQKLYRVYDIVKDRIYLSNGTDEVYSVNLELEDMRFVLEGTVAGTLVTVMGDELLYIKYGQRVIDENGTVKMVLYDLYHAPLSAPTSGECLISNVGGCKKYQDKIYYYLDVPENIENGISKSKHDILYEYSFDTDSLREVYNITGKGKDWVYSDIGDQYVICFETDLTSKETCYVAINLETGTTSKIPY